MIQSTIRPDNTEVIDRLMYKHADSWRIRFDENGNFAIFAESFLICRSCIDEIEQTYGRRLTKISTAVVKGSDGIILEFSNGNKAKQKDMLGQSGIKTVYHITQTNIILGDKCDNCSMQLDSK